MRSQKRIRPILNKLAHLWARNPDLRLGQLMVKLANHSAEFPNLNWPDMFHIKDSEMEARLDKMLAKQKRPHAADRVELRSQPSQRQ